MPDSRSLASPEIIPNPDPSTMTGNAIDRAVSNLSRIIEAKFIAVNVRLDGMEKAVEVFQSDLTRVPTQLDRAITGLRDVLSTRMDGNSDSALKEIEKLASVTTERFVGVGSQFAERDTRTDQRAGDTKLAVDAAFAAAKEATAKIEAGFTKQIDAMISIIDTKTGNLASGLGDLKERLTVIEATTRGISAANLDQRSNRLETHNQQVDSHGNTAIIISVVAVVVSVALSLVIHFIK